MPLSHASAVSPVAPVVAGERRGRGLIIRAAQRGEPAGSTPIQLRTQCLRAAGVARKRAGEGKFRIGGRLKHRQVCGVGRWGLENVLGAAQAGCTVARQAWLCAWGSSRTCAVASRVAMAAAGHAGIACVWSRAQGEAAGARGAEAHGTVWQGSCPGVWGQCCTTYSTAGLWWTRFRCPSWGPNF